MMAWYSLAICDRQVAPPAENGYAFKFNKRIASHSFDPTLQISKQSFRSSTSRASFLEPAENKALLA